MARLLTELAGAGWITKLDGDDSRLIKIEQASDALAKSLAAEPDALIGATLAALDPEVPADDPAMVRAAEALLDKWPTMRTVHVDAPVTLLRAVLLDAIVRAADGERAAVVWLTAADMLPFARLGRGERAICGTMQALADALEVPEAAGEGLPNDIVRPLLSSGQLQSRASSKFVVDRTALYQMIAGAVGPGSREGTPLKDPNPYWPNQAQNWAYEYAPRMGEAIAKMLDALANDVGTGLNALEGILINRLNDLGADLRAIGEDLADRLDKSIAAIKSNNGTQLETLWWSQALYSPTTRGSYRSLPPALAAITMAHDLAEEIPAPCAASVGYLLAETITRLPDVGFAERQPISAWLEAIARDREALPADHRFARRPPPSGRLGFDDLAVLALQGADLAAALRRTALPAEAEISLPDLAHAVFHQRQARDLAARLS